MPACGGPGPRVLASAIGGLAAGLLLWLAEHSRTAALAPHGGDYIETLTIGEGRLNMKAGLLKVLASLLVVSTGGAVGRKGAMVLLAAMSASTQARRFGRTVELHLVVN